jgi:hypothetical protein
MAEPIYCPFCGTKHALIPECSGRHQQIVCGACGARGPEVYRWLPYATAVESWNVRQEPTDTNITHRASGVTPTPKGSNDAAR